MGALRLATRLQQLVLLEGHSTNLAGRPLVSEPFTEWSLRLLALPMQAHRKGTLEREFLLHALLSASQGAHQTVPDRPSLGSQCRLGKV